MREIGFTSKVFTPHSIVGQLSGGERQGVAIARAIYKQADLIMLDEPTTALSLTETAKVFHFVRQVRASGRSILFIGHNIHHVFDIADRFVVLDRGRVALEATEARVRLGRGAHQLHGAARASRQRAAEPDREHGAMSEIAEQPTAAARSRGLAATRTTIRCGGFVLDNRAALGSLAVFVVMLADLPRSPIPPSSPPGRSTARC